MTDVVSSRELIARLRVERSPLAHQAADTIERLDSKANKYKFENWHLREKLREAYEALAGANRTPSLTRITEFAEAATSGQFKELRDSVRELLEKSETDSLAKTHRTISDAFEDIEKKAR